MEVRYYQTSAGTQPFVEWMQGLADRQARSRIEVRLVCVTVGNRNLNVPKRISKTTKRALHKGSRAAHRRGRGAVFPPSLPYEPWLIERLKDPAEAAAYLEAVIEDGHQAAIMLALRQVAQAQGGLARIARMAKLTREATYKMLSKSGNPELRSLTAVLKATGLRIAVKPIEKRAA